MEHLSDRELLDTLNQSLPDAEAAQEHLRSCPACRARLEEFRGTWDVLGQWAVPEPRVDLTERVLAKAWPARSVQLWRVATLGRVAASILVGTAVGVLSALPMRGEVSAQQAADSMYLDVLAADSATGWAGPLLSGETEN